MMISRKEFRFICFVIAFAGNLSIEGRADNQLDQMDGNILINASMFGLISVIPLLAVVNGLSAIQVEISAYLFGGAVLTSAISTFIGSVIRRRPLLRSAKDALSGMCCFVLGGLLPFVIGITVPNRIARDISLFGVTAAIIALLLTVDFLRKKDAQLNPQAQTYWILGVSMVISIALIVFFADQANHLRSASNKQTKI